MYSVLKPRLKHTKNPTNTDRLEKRENKASARQVHRGRKTTGSWESLEGQTIEQFSPDKDNQRKVCNRSASDLERIAF